MKLKTLVNKTLLYDRINFQKFTNAHIFNFTAHT